MEESITEHDKTMTTTKALGVLKIRLTDLNNFIQSEQFDKVRYYFTIYFFETSEMMHSMGKTQERSILPLYRVKLLHQSLEIEPFRDALRIFKQASPLKKTSLNFSKRPRRGRISGLILEAGCQQFKILYLITVTNC